MVNLFEINYTLDEKYGVFNKYYSKKADISARFHSYI